MNEEATTQSKNQFFGDEPAYRTARYMEYHWMRLHT